MSIESDCYSFLSGTTAITDLVGTRIYPEFLPQNPVYPALTYRLISAPHDHTLTAAAGVVRVRFQFDAFSERLSETSEIIEAIRLSLQRATGDFGDSEIMASRQDNEQFFGMEPMDASQQYLYRKTADYIIRLRATIPV
ncbi:MAG: DUF3168 domain-containing protein [Planctomycetaceae bacterium]